MCSEARKKSNKKAREARRQWYLGLLNERFCEICGENDPITLDWHHKDPDVKEANVSNMYKSYGRQAILDEIAKCQCLCANCHRKVHRDLRTGA